jgi:hypothetical protein
VGRLVTEEGHMQAESRVWVDAAGNRTITLVRTVAGAATIAAGVALASEADWLQQWESVVATNAPAPLGGAYLPVSLRASLAFVCADTTLAVLYVPSPSLAVFLADGQTVDSSNPAVAGIIAACVGSLTSSTGSPATAFVSGVLQRGAAQTI